MNNQTGKLLLHPKTKLRVEYLLTDPAHAVLITGPAGSGKKTLAQALAADLLEVAKSADSPYFFRVTRLKNKQNIAIEQVKEIISALKLKALGSKKIQRVIFVEDAHFLSIQAQNALLKILEEPPEATIFLLSANSTQSVLPTIASRARELNVQQVSFKYALNYWEEQYPYDEIKSAWLLSGGSVGLLHALLTGNKEHPLKEAVDQARRFLGAKKYQRLLITDSLSRNKEQFGLFLEALSKILSFVHRGSVSANKAKQSKALLESRQELQRLQKAYMANSNLKILALRLSINLKV